MMRNSTTIFVVFVLLALGFAPKSEAQNTYLGKFCWDVTFTGATAKKTLVLNVFAQDNGIYALYGTIAGGGGIFYDGNVHGTATTTVFIDNTLRMSLSGSGTDPVMNKAWGGIFDAVLNVSTLAGTMHFLRILSLEDIEATMAPTTVC